MTSCNFILHLNFSGNDFVFANQYLFVLSLHFIHTHFLNLPILNILPQNSTDKPFWLIISILVWPQSSAVSLVPKVCYPSFLIFLPPENCISHFTWTLCQLWVFLLSKRQNSTKYITQDFNKSKDMTIRLTLWANSLLWNRSILDWGSFHAKPDVCKA